eukprot:TRINITY_DN7119_c0_g4_i1.p1 TRINITY_DN7119_c0_g4~~TRINITY_DN7119_c0_g4_i1.p1  ORF type:complete len:460 (-),score=123.92 TRINITY_DN7119_c0_g4_i1:102-1481(-)
MEINSNLHHIAQFASKPNPTVRSPDILDQAYGLQSFPSLVEKIKYGTTIIQQKALSTVCSQLPKPENVIISLQCEIFGALLGCLSNTDDEIRLHTTKAISLLVTAPKGRSDAIKHKVVHAMVSGPLHDNIAEIRNNVYSFLSNMSLSKDGCHELIDTKAIEVLVMILASSETLPLKETILNPLINCFKLDPLLVISLNTMTVLLNQIKTMFNTTHSQAAHTNIFPAETVHAPSPKLSPTSNIAALPPLTINLSQLSSIPSLHLSIVINCIKGIEVLSAPYEGKNEAIKCGAVEVLLKFIDFSPLQNAVVSALMPITICNEAKFICISNKATTSLLTMLENFSHKKPKELVPIIKVTTNLAESPEGRMQLSPALPILKKIATPTQQTPIPQPQHTPVTQPTTTTTTTSLKQSNTKQAPVTLTAFYAKKEETHVAHTPILSINDVLVESAQKLIKVLTWTP